MLSNIPVLIDQIKRRFTAEEIGWLGIEFRPSTISDERLARLERDLGIALPEIFKEFILTYDLMNLNVGRIFFGSGTEFGTYADFLLADNGHSVGWWGQGKRPQTLLLIGGTDPYSLLLDSSNDRILAFIPGEDDWEDAKMVAPNINVLLRAEGSLFLDNHKLDAVLLELSEATNGECNEKFWIV